MEINEKIGALHPDDFITISESEVDQLLVIGDIISEKDTLLSGMIRIIRLANHIFLQEFTDKNEYIVRRLSDLDSAQSIYSKRLDTYERMWDGCGCKVNYYNGPIVNSDQILSFNKK